MIELNIDPEFEKIIPPLTDDEYRQLEENIVSEGIVLTPLIVWNGTIVDGHNRYKIIKQHPEVECRTYEKKFDNRYEAISWICNNQLGRRNLTEFQKKYLIGHRFEAEKLAFGGDRKSDSSKSSDQNDRLIVPGRNYTRRKIAKETNTSEAYVMRAGSFSKGVDAAESTIPGIKQEILTGIIKPTSQAVEAIARASPKERPQMVEQLRVPKPKPERPVKPTPPPDEEPEMVRTFDNISVRVEASSIPPITEEDILHTMEGASEIFITTCEKHFLDFPKLITDRKYLKRVQKIMSKPYYHIKEKIKEINT